MIFGKMRLKIGRAYHFSVGALMTQERGAKLTSKFKMTAKKALNHVVMALALKVPNFATERWNVTMVQMKYFVKVS